MVHGLTRSFSCELCTKRTWNRIQMIKHKTSAHDISEVKICDVPNESDSTCPVCKKGFRSTKIRDMHFKYSKKCNPIKRNVQSEKLSIDKRDVPKETDQNTLNEFERSIPPKDEGIYLRANT